MSTLRKPEVKVKRAMKRHRVTYQVVAARAGVSWFMVWAVLNGRKRSARVLDAARDAVAEARTRQGSAA